MAIDPAKPFDLKHVATPTYSDMRLDSFVKAMVPSMSRTKIQKYIKNKQITVNGKTQRANWIVRLEDTVILHCKEPEGAVEISKNIPLDIVYEDDDIVAINKQTGLVVHPVALHRHDTLLNALYWRYKDIIPDDEEISLGNRLDQHTSGLILVAKNTASKRILQDQFENRKTKKVYNAICSGIVENDSGEIDAPIGPGEGAQAKCMVIRDDKDGKASNTFYKVLKRFKPQEADKGFTLVQLEPHTGRQHQLRVHMQHIGHPLVCDDRYGDPRTLEITTSGKKAIMARYALHAVELTFMHPNGEEMTLQAPLANDFKDTVTALEQDGTRGLFYKQEE